MSLEQRTIRSAGWSTTANLIVNGVSFLRSIFLARWLAVEVFGTYGYATAILAIAGVVADFGMSAAFLHRSTETADEESTARVHLTLRLLLSAAWATLMVAGALIFTSGSLRSALLWLILIRTVSQLVQTPELILLRRVMLQRISVVRVVSTIVGSIAALMLAWHGRGIWALLAVEAVTVLVRFAGLFVWRPVWRPRLGWSLAAISYFFRFGSRAMAADTLAMIIDRIDDLWTGATLGQVALGYYSRAYTFATYPRLAITSSIGGVTSGVYAELAGDRRRLSQAFFRLNALLVRVGFFGAGLLALIAPEFIRLVLGSKWLPMLLVFRLMLVFTMLDPIKNTVGILFVAVGRPERLMQVRAAQLGVLLLGLVTLGSTWELPGVAVAVDVMLVTGLGLLLWQASSYVDFSAVQMFASPLVALFVAMAAARGSILLMTLLDLPFSDWVTGAAKAVIFALGYVGLLWIFERERIIETVRWLDSARRRSMAASQ